MSGKTARDPGAKVASPSVAPENGGSSFVWILVLWLAAVLFFWRVLFDHQSFYFRDTSAFYFPQAQVTVKALQEGRIPHWVPTIGAGYPFQADPHSMVFYPLTILFLFLPLVRAYNWFVWLHVPLGGTFLYALLRRWRLSRPAAAFGAFVLMFCGYTISTTCLTTLLRGTIWAPAALLAFDAFLVSGSRRAIVATALVLAIQGSGTDPQYVLFTGLLLLALPWLRPGAEPGRWRANLVGAAVSGGIALGLLAYQYLPLGQLIAHSDRATAAAQSEVGSFTLDPWNLYNAVLPAPFPEPDSPFYLASFHGGEVPFYPDIYWGFPVLAFAIASLGWRAKSSKVPAGQPRRNSNREAARVAMGVALLTALISLGDATPIFRLLLFLVPPMKLFRYPGKWLLVTAIAVSISAALGFEGIFLEQEGCSELFRKALRTFGGLCLAGIVLLKLSGYAVPTRFLTWHQTPVGNTNLIFANLKAAWLVDLFFALMVLIAMGGLLVLAARAKISRGGALALAAFLSLGDLFWCTQQSFPTVGEGVLVEHPSVKKLLDPVLKGVPPPRYVCYPPLEATIDSERTVFQYVMLSLAMMFNLRGCFEDCNMLYSCMSVRTAAFTDLTQLVAKAERGERDRVSQAMGVHHLIRPAFDSISSDMGRLAGKVGPIAVEELPSPTPRAFIATKALGVSLGGKPATLDSIEAMPLLVQFEPPALGDVPRVLTPKSIKRCSIVRYEPERVEIEFDLEGSGLLVLLDAYYPNWTAKVDGKERPIYQVVEQFRGVRVEQGEHRLVMTYEPWPFKVGSLISLMVLACSTLAMIRLRPRHQAA